MGIVDTTYYNETYIGEPIPTTDFARYEAHAERLIDLVCRGQFVDTLPPRIVIAYKNAICAQMEYYLVNGLLEVTTGDSGTGFSVGRVSVNNANSTGSFDMRGAAMLSPAAQMYLEQTGLLGRAVAVPVEPFAPFPWSVIC